VRDVGRPEDYSRLLELDGRRTAVCSERGERGVLPGCGTALEARHQKDRDQPRAACGFIHYLDPKVAVAVVLGDDVACCWGGGASIRAAVDGASQRAT
jgi:hypothetical protein